MDSKTLPILIPIVAVVLLAVVVLFARRDSGPEPISAATPPPAAEVVEDAPRFASAAPAAAPLPVREPAQPAARTAPPAPVEDAASAAEAPAPVVEAALAGPATVVVRVVEENGGSVLRGANVRLVRSGLSVDRSPRRSTNDAGEATFEDVDAGMYVVNVEWGQGPLRPAGRVIVPEQGIIEAEVEYFERMAFLMQLVDETGAAIPNQTLTVTPGGGWGGRGGPRPEEVTTDEEGFFELRGFEETSAWIFRGEGDVLFSAGEDRRWGNPYTWRRSFTADDGDVLIMRREIVQARGRLVNAPPLGENQVRRASLAGAEVNWRTLTVERNRFEFEAAPGADVQITITRGDRRGRWGGGGGDTEKRETIRMPSQGGVFEFEIEYDPMLVVAGVVLGPDGAGVPRVVVDARSEGGERLSFRSDRTDENGAFSVELMPAASYVFSPDTRSMPREMRGFTPETKRWRELEAGSPIVLRLETSSTVWGEVVDERGQPVPGAVVSMQGRGVTWRAWDVNTRTDEAGLFRLDIPPVAAREAGADSNVDYVTAMGMNHGVGWAEAKVDDTESPVRITMRPFVDARLTVTAGGVPVESIDVTSLYHVPWQDSPMQIRGWGTTASGPGVFEVSRLVPGIGSLRVTGRVGDQRLTRTVQIPDNARTPFPIRIDLSSGD